MINWLSQIQTGFFLSSYAYTLINLETLDKVICIETTLKISYHAVFFKNLKVFQTSTILFSILLNSMKHS